MRVRFVQILLTLPVMLLVYFLAGLAAAMGWIDPASVVSKTPYLNLLSETLKQTLDSYWQLLAALSAGLASFAPLKAPAKYLEERIWKQGRPLYLPKDPPNDLHFSARLVPQVGRNREMAELKAFLEAPGKFRWWWLLGGAGSGKSRLALEWLIQLRRRKWLRYETGFFRMLEDRDYWKTWEPRRFTVIVFDDAASSSAAALELAEILASRSSELRHPVRLLVVERNVPKSLDPLESRSQLAQFRHRQAPLELLQLGSGELHDMRRELTRKRKREILLTGEAEAQILAESEGAPLLMLAALDELARQGSLAASTRLELLRDQGRFLREKLTQAGVDESCHSVIALVTFTRGLGWNEAKAYQADVKCYDKRLLDRLFHQDTAVQIPPLTPALFGDAFVLDQFWNLNSDDREKFLKAAWAAKPENVSQCLIEMAKTWGNDPKFAAIDQVPDVMIDATIWAGIRSWLFSRESISQELAEWHWQRLDAAAKQHPDWIPLRWMHAQCARHLMARYAGEPERMAEFYAPVKQAVVDFPSVAIMQEELAEVELHRLYGAENETPEVQAAILESIEKVTGAFAEDEGVQAVWGHALQVYCGFTIHRQEWREMDQTIATLRSLASRFKGNAKIQACLAGTAANVVSEWNRQQRWNEVVGILGEVQECLRRFPQDWQVAFAAGSAIANGMEAFRECGQLSESRAAIEELKTAAQRVDDQALWSVYAVAAHNAVRSLATSSDSAGVVALVKDLREIEKRYAHEALPLAMEKGSVRAVGLLGQASVWDAMEQVLTELEQRAAAMPQRIEAQRAYGEAAKHAVIAYSAAAKWAEARAKLERLGEFSSRFHSDHELQMSLLGASYLFISDQCKSERLDEIAFALGLIELAGKRMHGDLEVSRPMVIGIAMGADAYMKAGRWREALEWWSKILAVASSLRSGDDAKIASEMERMHANALVRAGAAQLMEVEGIAHPLLSNPFHRWKRSQSLRRAEDRLRHAATTNNANTAALHSWARSEILLAEMRWWGRARLLRSGIEHLKEVVTREPNNYFALNHLGVGLMYLGKTERDRAHYEEARMVYIQAESLHPGAAAYNLACLSALEGDAEGCRGWLEAAQRAGTSMSPSDLAADVDLKSVRHLPWFKTFLQSETPDSSSYTKDHPDGARNAPC
jgi:Flp pilus assembly protein TadD